MAMVNFAVLGCGRIGRMHAANLARHPDVSLLAVYDVAADASAAVAQRHGVRQAQSVAELLDDPRIDAVLIASPTDTHVDLIVASARAGKAVLCEKPIDLDLARAERCRDEIASFAPTVMIGFQRRFDPSIAALRRRAREGEIGRLEQMIITSRDPAPPPLGYIAVSGGLFRDMTIHDFDIARFVAGEIVAVSAFGDALVDPAIGGAGDIDSAMVTLRSASGMLIHINNARRSAYGYDQRIELFGERGMLRVGNHRATSVESWTGEATEAADPALHFFIERYADAYTAEISHFVACLRDGAAPQPGFEDGLAALRIADAALESLQSGRVVRLDG